ncbi:GDP-6-deoxy-D-lyxo-4-hexulose reductase [Polymorphobacter multimanifer]|uniref:NAD-dependent epimerase/dehydratase family protein n=1 Tax=Polymorphobacter multimanifer TaxID=1070431 RepID=UPI00166925EC|nr:NAD-dependent epimerase/dehydratase family protein [Polymorphobacter multimanifer]GGI78832.1 GDP-6-deoxy-D-lyxo-4-hexulose reductase [Polymorphobacter multimanifer]
MAFVLITGAEGFTGRHLITRLAAEGHELHGLVHREGAPIDGLAGQHVADLRDPAAMTALVAAVRPERVVHLAGIAFVAHDDVRALYETNVLGTRNLLHALAALAQPPAAVMLASSANVYGNRREGVLTEDLPPAPANDYGVTKMACEHLAGVYADRLPIITVRPFNYTGRGQAGQFVVPKIIAHARARQTVIELGNIGVARDFSDVRAVVDAYARLLVEPAAIGGLFNVCSGGARPLSEIIGLVEQLAGIRFEGRVNPAAVRADEVRSLCGSRARLEAVIGALETPTIEETLAWMLDE